MLQAPPPSYLLLPSTSDLAFQQNRAVAPPRAQLPRYLILTSTFHIPSAPLQKEKAKEKEKEKGKGKGKGKKKRQRTLPEASPPDSPRESKGTVPVAFSEARFQVKKSACFWRHGRFFFAPRC